MAVQKNVIKGILAGTFALMLSGCVTVPDAIKGSSPTPQQDLVRVMSAACSCTLVRRHALVAKWLRYKTSK